MTTVRGITSRVDIIWSIGGRGLDEMRAVSPTDDPAVYTVTHTIPQLNTTDDHTEYYCEVFISCFPSISAFDVVTLDLMG